MNWQQYPLIDNLILSEVMFIMAREEWIYWATGKLPDLCLEKTEICKLGFY